MKKPVGAAVAAVLVAGAGVLAYSSAADPVADCKREAAEAHARIAEALEVYATVMLTEPTFLEDCELGELGAAGEVVIPQSVGEVEALEMLGDGWSVNDTRLTATAADTGWRAYVRGVEVDGEPALEVSVYP